MADVLRGPGYIDTTYPDKWTNDPFFAGTERARRERRKARRREKKQNMSDEEYWAKHWEGIQKTGIAAANNMSGGRKRSRQV